MIQKILVSLCNNSLHASFLWAHEKQETDFGKVINYPTKCYFLIWFASEQWKKTQKSESINGILILYIVFLP